MSEAEKMTFTLLGTPVAKGRPRFTATGRAYTDAKTKAAEQSILAVYLVNGGKHREPHAGPVSIEITATFTPPESWPKWKRELAFEGDWPHITKPDFDNLMKTIDGLNGVAWLDDSQIIAGNCRKRYGPYPETSVTIWFHPVPTKPTSRRTHE